MNKSIRIFNEAILLAHPESKEVQENQKKQIDIIKRAFKKLSKIQYSGLGGWTWDKSSLDSP